jgi:hypothetical protein
MSNRTPLSPARRATAGGLTVAAAGIAILYVAGIAMPVVPPGLVLLVVGAILVGTVRRRWALAVGLLVGLAEVMGFFASGSVAALTDLTSVSVLAGTWIRLLGLVVAVAAGVWAMREAVPAAAAAGDEI